MAQEYRDKGYIVEEYVASTCVICDGPKSTYYTVKDPITKEVVDRWMYGSDTNQYCGGKFSCDYEYSIDIE